MAAKVKSLLTVVTEVVETAAGYAFLAVAIYSTIFVDITGNGSLWNSLRHLKDGVSETAAAPNATRVIKVPTQVAKGQAHEDRILAVFDEAPPENAVAVYQARESAGARPEAAFTDTPADPDAGDNWKVGLKGELRKFTVYGKGDQTSSAAAAAAAAPAPAEPALAVVPASGSAARAAAESTARPGMGSRLSRGALAASETSRNVR
ncbi:MAG: hypothetical protein Q7J64_02430 [Elusimicrobiota bacterium]|nr:hypothetical protein [Elusimicrobiota bacterium]